MIGTYERTAEKLLIGQRKSSTIGKLINGRFVIFKSDLSKTVLYVEDVLETQAEKMIS